MFLRHATGPGGARPPRVLTASIIPLLLILPAAQAGCFHRPVAVSSIPAPAPAKPVTGPEDATKHFKAGQYLDAAQAYEYYLRQNPNAPDRDETLFRLAMSYALAGNEPENFRRAQNLLRTQFTQFPDSQYRPAVEYILSLQTDIDRLRVDLREKSDRIREQEEALKIKDSSIAEIGKNIEERENLLRYKDRILREKERILLERGKTIQELEDKILKLSQELDRMKRIDLQRQPSRPPDR